MLVAIQSSPYFAKYLRSQNPIAAGGKRLTQVLGERLLEFAPTIDRLSRTNQPTYGYALDFAGSAVQLLSTLLTIFIRDKDQKTVLSEETKDGLKPWIRSWLQRYPREFLAGPCERVLLAFNRDLSFVEDAKTIRRSLKNWNECGLPSCPSTASLKVCSRCVISLTCCNCSDSVLQDAELSVMYGFLQFRVLLAKSQMLNSVSLSISVHTGTPAC